MKAFKVFIFGLLYGWFFKIAFDRIYRENEIEDLRSENASLREYIRTLESQLQARSRGGESVRGTVAVSSSPAEAPTPEQPASQKDDLKMIKGIGPAIEKKLNSAGIHTYAALAALSQQQLEEILGNQLKRLKDEKDLIAQAKKLAKKR
jgi:predicted flap endonuclease-1-like 5' DNA nuclease